MREIIGVARWVNSNSSMEIVLTLFLVCRAWSQHFIPALAQAGSKLAERIIYTHVLILELLWDVIESASLHSARPDLLLRAGSSCQEMSWVLFDCFAYRPVLLQYLMNGCQQWAHSFCRSQMCFGLRIIRIIVLCCLISVRTCYPPERKINLIQLSNNSHLF